MSVHKVYTTTKVSNNSGLVALQRGPLVYCVEGIDNQNDILSLSISKDAEFLVQPYEENVLSGTVTLTFTGLRTEEVNTLYTYTKPKEHPFTITAIPYYTWGNRGISQMRVWLPEKC